MQKHLFKNAVGRYGWLKHSPKTNRYELNGWHTQGELKALGYTLIPRRRFINTKTQKYYWLEYDPATAKALYVSRWYNLNTLNIGYCLKESPEIVQLSSARSTNFGDPGKYKGKWETSRAARRGKTKW